MKYKYYRHTIFRSWTMIFRKGAEGSIDAWDGKTKEWTPLPESSREYITEDEELTEEDVENAVFLGLL